MNVDPMTGESTTPVSAHATVASVFLPSGIEAVRVRNELERIVVSAASRSEGKRLQRFSVRCQTELDANDGVSIENKEPQSEW